MVDTNQTNLKCKSGNVIKQGDTSSVFRYELSAGEKKKKTEPIWPSESAAHSSNQRVHRNPSRSEK